MIKVRPKARMTLLAGLGFPGRYPHVVWGSGFRIIDLDPSGETRVSGPCDPERSIVPNILEASPCLKGPMLL